jgi:hypothetical protein
MFDLFQALHSTVSYLTTRQAAAGITLRTAARRSKAPRCSIGTTRSPMSGPLRNPYVVNTAALYRGLPTRLRCLAAGSVVLPVHAWLKRNFPFRVPSLAVRSERCAKRHARRCRTTCVGPPEGGRSNFASSRALRCKSEGVRWVSPGGIMHGVARFVGEAGGKDDNR